MRRVKSISCRRSAAVSRCYRDYRCRRHRQDARPLASFHPACVRWSMARPDLRAVMAATMAASTAAASVLLNVLTSDEATAPSTVPRGCGASRSRQLGNSGRDLRVGQNPVRQRLGLAPLAPRHERREGQKAGRGCEAHRGPRIFAGPRPWISGLLQGFSHFMECLNGRVSRVGGLLPQGFALAGGRGALTGRLAAVRLRLGLRRRGRSGPSAVHFVGHICGPSFRENVGSCRPPPRRATPRSPAIDQNR